MNKFASWRLGKTSVEDIHIMNKLPAGIQDIPQRFNVRCTQVPQDFEVGTYVFIWLGSDNNKGIPTEWKQGFKAIGRLLNIQRGVKFSEVSISQIEVIYVFTEAFNRIDILRDAPIPYYSCSAFPIIGLDDHSNQTIRMFTEGEERTEMPAFFEVMRLLFHNFFKDALKIDPSWESLFSYHSNRDGGFAQIVQISHTNSYIMVRRVLANLIPLPKRPIREILFVLLFTLTVTMLLLLAHISRQWKM